MSRDIHHSREIDGKGRTVRELLAGRKYSIDYFQREYKWEKKQVSELLEDLVDSSHFGGIELNLMLAGFAPNRQPGAGGGSIADRHRRAAAPGLWGPERRRELRRYPRSETTL